MKTKTLILIIAALVVLSVLSLLLPRPLTGITPYHCGLFSCSKG